MTGSISDNAVLYKKKTSTYVPPTELIESTSYTLDFAAHFMKKIFGFMGHILSFISDTPHKYKRVIFYEDEKMKLSRMMYSGENVLVIETKNRDGCRVLLNRGDLLRLQYLELAECRESAQLLIALVHLPLLVFGLPYILWCVSCLRRVVAFWVKPGVLVVVANSDTNLRMCNNISNASLVHYNYWCAYYPDTCHGHSSIRITLDTRHGHTNLAL
ncbi:hypothetical protein AGLY_007400 [Aphis glycines]|uniref:Uncharacterized protein n=1 Tax=Aphis glycines TaxID=307491 RepID=A0A6G0TNI3_APHGL|nr:hypothetical protein AGLY_007400 [Aphis glycines]